MKEDALLGGPLEPTNEAYAVAKIAGVTMCQAYWRQYGCRFISVMPTNLYGPGDNFDLEGGHVLPALIRRFHEAKEEGREGVVVWGTGTPRREFAYFGPTGRGVSVEVEGLFRSKWKGRFGDVALPFRHMWHVPELRRRSDAG